MNDSLLPAIREYLAHFQFLFAVRSDVGRKRSENQDSYAIARSEKGRLFIVADGMGGSRGGATASAIAVNIIARDSFLPDGSLSPASVRTALDRANKEIHRRGTAQESLRGMGTTVVVLAIASDAAFLVHTGDSRIYCLRRDQELQQLTKDHSLVRELVDSGAISEADASKHPIGHMLTRSLGTNASVEAEVQDLPEPLTAGQKFFLCSDGLYNHVSDEEIRTALLEGDTTQAADRLLRMALDGGGTDNITVEVIEVRGIEDTAQSQEAVTFEREGVVELCISSPMPTEVEIVSAAAQSATEASEQSESKAEPEIERDTSDSTVRQSEKPSRAKVESVSDKPKVASSIDDRLEKKLIDQHQESEAKRERNLVILYGGWGLILIVFFYSATLLLNRVQQDDGTASESHHAGIDMDWAFQQHRQNVAAQNEKKAPGVSTILDSAMDGTASQSGSAVSQLTIGGATSETTSPALTIGGSSSEANLQVENNVPVVPPETMPPSITESDILNPVIEPKEIEIPLSADSRERLTEDLVVGDALDRRIAAAFDLSIPAVPEVSLPTRQSSPNDPIQWEKEQEAANLSQMEDAFSSSSSAGTFEFVMHGNSRVLSEQERIDTFVQKMEARQELGDIDSQLRFLPLASDSQMKTEHDRLRENLTEIQESLERLRQRKNQTLSSYSRWLQFNARLGEGDIARVAQEMEQENDSIADIRRQYLETSQRYLAVVRRWESMGRTDRDASEMGALGREIQTKKSELQQRLSGLIRSTLQGLLFDFARFSVGADLLELEKSNVNRHLGILKTLKADAPMEIRRKHRERLLKQRNEVAKKLQDLTALVSNDDEMIFRMKRAREAIDRR